MLGLTTLGILHTAISLVAVAAGIVAFARDGRITLGNRVGRIYVITTVLTCLTGFGIFQHGGFGKPHALGVLTLLVLLLAWGAGRRGWFGRAAPYVETVLYSLTFFFHMIPGFTESLTRLPQGNPWAANDADPKLQALVGAAFLVFLIGATWQVLRIRRERRQPVLA